MSATVLHNICIKESFYSLHLSSDIFYITKMGLSDTNRHSVCLQIKYQYLMSRNLCNIATQNITLFLPIFPTLLLCCCCCVCFADTLSLLCLVCSLHIHWPKRRCRAKHGDPSNMHQKKHIKWGECRTTLSHS